MFLFSIEIESRYNNRKQLNSKQQFSRIIVSGKVINFSCRVLAFVCRDEVRDRHKQTRNAGDPFLSRVAMSVFHRVIAF